MLPIAIIQAVKATRNATSGARAGDPTTRLPDRRPAGGSEGRAITNSAPPSPPAVVYRLVRE